MCNPSKNLEGLARVGGLSCGVLVLDPMWSSSLYSPCSDCSNISFYSASEMNSLNRNFDLLLLCLLHFGQMNITREIWWLLFTWNSEGSVLLSCRVTNCEPDYCLSHVMSIFAHVILHDYITLFNEFRKYYHSVGLLFTTVTIITAFL